MKGMKKLLTIKRKIWSILLCAVMLSGFSWVMPVQGQDITNIELQISQTTNQISSLQSSVTSLQQQANSYLSKKNSIAQNLSEVESLLSSAQNKENQITTLINSLQALQSAAQSQLAQEEVQKDANLKSLYEESQQNNVIVFLSSNNAQSFLLNLAFNEADVNDQKQQILALNGQITSLQTSLNQDNQEKATQAQQVKTLQNQKAQLQYELQQAQNAYTNTSQTASSDQAQVSSLENQLGTLTAQEQAIIQEKIDDSFAQGGGGGGGNSNNPPGSPGNFSLQINGVYISNNFPGPVIVQPASSTEYSQVSGNSATASYTGNIEFRTNTDVNFIDQTSMENYVAGIGEMPSSWQMQALDAQAIAARTYAVNHKGEHASEGYDVLDDTSDQAYNGYQTDSRLQAAQNTRGQVIYYNGSPIDALYSANNGGYERSNNEVWGTSQLPYLPSQSDNSGSSEYDYANSYCQGIYATSALFGGGSQSSFPLSIQGTGIGSLYDIVGAALFEHDNNGAPASTSTSYASDIQNGGALGTVNINGIGNFSYMTETYDNGASGNSNISIQALEQSGMSSKDNNGSNAHDVATVTLYGTNGNNTVSVPGNLFVKYFNTRSPGTTGNPPYYYLTNQLWYGVNNGSNMTFYVSGFGHTIGMSQCGAEGRAIAGQNDQQILSFYYKGTSINTDSAITNTPENSCLQIESNYPDNDACIRIGITPQLSGGRDNTVVVSGAYTIYSDGVPIYTSKNPGGSDKIEVTQN